MKKYNRFNFFKHTFCEFLEVSEEEVSSRTANYKSESGSIYYFDDAGVYRYSNHWGRAANCRWRLISTKSKSNGYKWGRALWSDFFPNNESEKLFFIEVNLETQEVHYQHKGKLHIDTETVPVLRTAIETAKRIKQIKELFVSNEWAKYLTVLDIISTRNWLIEELISTNKSIMQLKLEISNEQKK